MRETFEISIIIPAFQEEKRIGHTMKELAHYLKKQQIDSEIILVLDGCTDQTAAVAQAAIAQTEQTLTVLDLKRNSGKGYAVKRGIMAARGKYLYFMDADLSFAPDLIGTFKERLQSGADIVIAQRQKSASYSEFGRRVLAAISRAVIGNIFLPGIRDTQAGFKAFQRHIAHTLFSELKTFGYLFDFELLLAARSRGYTIEKVYVEWSDRPGSKVCLIRDSMSALIDLIFILVRNLIKTVKKP